jgi:hypothetical protein
MVCAKYKNDHLPFGELSECGGKMNSCPEQLAAASFAGFDCVGNMNSCLE